MSEKDMTTGDFARLSSQSPPTDRERVDGNPFIVTDEDNLPESAKGRKDPSESSQGPRKVEISPFPHSRAATPGKQSGPDVVSHAFDRDLPQIVDGPNVVKRRVYIDDPAELPQGATLEVGPEGGMFYDDADVQEFRSAMEAHTSKVFDQFNFTDEQKEEAERIAEFYEEEADEIFGTILEASSEFVNQGEYRVKEEASMLEKVFERDNEYESLDELTDVFGGRVFAQNADEIQDTAEAIEERVPYDVVEKKDYVDEPQDGYYRAVHYIFEDDEGRSIELQVKSKEIEDAIDVGHATVYKNIFEMPDDVLEDIQECLTDVMDEIFGEITDPDCTATAVEAIQEVQEELEE